MNSASSRVAFGVATAAVFLLALTGCSSTATNHTSGAAVSAATALTGTVGAAHYDDGYAVIGSGVKTVDVYLDPMCPYCRMFEQANNIRLTADANHGVTTVRVHPVAILDRLSQGSRYSTRAAATIMNVAAHHPDKLAAYVTALYAHQPVENTTGLTDTELGKIATNVGAPLQTKDLAREQAWVTTHTQAALTGPLPDTTDVPVLTSVPAVFVNSHHYTGDSNDQAAFTRFYNEH